MAINKVIYNNNTLLDLSQDTVSNSDHIMQGYVGHLRDGSVVTGTGQGGGTPIMKYGVVRPDATLAHVFEFDQLLVQDMGITLPTYSTSTRTLRTGTALAAVSVDFETYNYFVVEKALSYPVYSDNVAVKGRQEWTSSVQCYEIFNIPANTAKALSQNKTCATMVSAIVSVGNSHRELYWSSTTALSINSGTSYGTAQTFTAPTISSNTINATSPTFVVRGSTTYFTQTAWNKMTDIRYQYRIEIWRVPIANVQGWHLTSGIQGILVDINNGGTLT